MPEQYQEVAIMSASAGSITLVSIPAKLQGEELEEYISTELVLGNDEDWIAADEIIIQDFRKNTEARHA